jgi:hypothetical protein
MAVVYKIYSQYISIRKHTDLCWEDSSRLPPRIGLMGLGWSDWSCQKKHLHTYMTVFMCVYMCVHIYVHIYVCIHIYIYTNILKPTHVYIYMQLSMYISIHIHDDDDIYLEYYSRKGFHINYSCLHVLRKTHKLVQ